MKIYSVYDKNAEEFGPIFEAKTHKVARMSVIRILEQNKIKRAEHILYEVGEILRTSDEITGKFYEKAKEIPWDDATTDM